MDPLRWENTPVFHEILGLLKVNDATTVGADLAPYFNFDPTLAVDNRLARTTARTGKGVVVLCNGLLLPASGSLASRLLGGLRLLDLLGAV